MGCNPLLPAHMLRHSPGQCFTRPCRCDEPQNGDRDCIEGVSEPFTIQSSFSSMANHFLLTPVNPAQLISPTGVRRCKPRPTCNLRHSQGLRFACPCRCGEPHKGDRDWYWGGRDQPCPTDIANRGSTVQAQTNMQSKTLPGAALRSPLPLRRTPKWR
jgi:hypothetical protein